MDFPQHSQHVLEQLNQQRQLGLLCDCTFVVDGVHFKAHKAVLAACSEYFKMLFVDQKDVVHLDISNAAGLGQVLEFMYTAKLSLSPENVDDVLAVATFLQMQDIITACHALKSLAEPATSPGGNAEALATEGGDKRAKEEKAATSTLSRLEQAGCSAPTGPSRDLKEERGGQAQSAASGESDAEDPAGCPVTSQRPGHRVVRAALGQVARASAPLELVLPRMTYCMSQGVCFSQSRHNSLS